MNLSQVKTFTKSSGFKKYFKNTSWLFFEKFLRLLSGLVVGVLVARHLGPEEFGLLNYAMSFVALFLSFSGLGLDSIVVKELVKEKDQKQLILGTSFGLKLIGALGVLFFILIAIFLSNNSAELNSILLIIAVAAVFQSFNVIDFYFQSTVESKYVVFANIFSLSLSAIFKLYLIYINASLFFFALAFTLDSFIVAIGLVYYYFSNGHRLRQWKFNKSIAMSLLKQSWPLVLAGVVVTVYMKIDQIMIKEMLGAEANGNYAAAVRISETWYFIPMVICSSLFPAIINAKNRMDGSYSNRLQNLYNFMVILALSVAVPITFLSEPIILFLFGDQYAQAIDVLTIHIWSGLFVSLGLASSLWLINENLQKISFYRTTLGAIVNIVLNFLLIPKYGIRGAALTTLFSQIVAALLFDLLLKKTRGNFVMKIKSLFLISPIQKLFKLEK